ncbi:hypothetical protein [Desulfosporosinus sp. BG]|uniref:hypothetical protein n=1 Tax=Desulfosporosinus sp. BG TaxID=1633135 RepID=UPI00083A55AB|nr:hypothetical protein [Desulfosporosinus sp. BG]ODA41431.1 hypothetical protein DSBG_1707 [Desulfosporosinus sp. BG]
MIYEVCTLVATIILGVLGIELMLWIRSVRKLTNEAKLTMQNLNAHLPHLLQDAQAVTTVVRQTSEQVGGTVSQVACGLEELQRNPLHFIKVFFEAVKQVMDLWHEIRQRKKEASDR